MIYLDHCATTPIRREVLDSMLPYLKGRFGNPSSLHACGKAARSAIDAAREQVARLIGADPAEIFFTSGGTESNNLALQGTATARRNRGNHIIISSIEHPSVIETGLKLESAGFGVTRIPVNGLGSVDPDDVKKAVTGRTILISVMHGNNEVGTLQPVDAIAEIAEQKGVPLHTDAVQTAGKVGISVKDLRADLISLSAHKLYGPKGAGALYIRKGLDIKPLLFGGHQESDIRSGTENVASIVGMGRACELAMFELQKEAKRLTELRDFLEHEIMKRIPGATVNGNSQNRLPHVLSISVAELRGEELVQEMDRSGFAISAGSACSSNKIEISHVLAAMQIPVERAAGTVRFSLGRGNTKQQMLKAASAFAEAVEKLKARVELEKSLGTRQCF